MRQFGEHPCFTAKALDCTVVRQVESLDCHRTAENSVGGQEHGAHPAVADGSLDHEPISDDVSEPHKRASIVPRASSV